jgi:hypothetical protein
MEQALEAVASQALYGAYDALAAGPLFASYREAFEGGLPSSVVAFDLLADADVAHLVVLASARPSRIAFRPEELDEIPGEWRQAISSSVVIEERMTRRLGIASVVDALR